MFYVLFDGDRTACFKKAGEAAAYAQGLGAGDKLGLKAPVSVGKFFKPKDYAGINAEAEYDDDDNVVRYRVIGRVVRAMGSKVLVEFESGAREWKRLDEISHVK